MKMTMQDFFNGRIGEITVFLYQKGFTMQQIIEEVENPEDSYQIECMGMYDCPSGRELQDFIHHSRWGQKIRREIKFLKKNQLEVSKYLLENKKKEN